MVGKDGRIHGITFAVRMQKYLHKPYREGAYGPDAYDCVGLIYAYLRDGGKDIADTWQAWSLSNYYSLARGNTVREKAVLRDWLLSLGTIAAERVAGDLLLIRGINGILFPAIYTGNGCGISVFQGSGVRPFKIDKNFTTELIIRV